MKKISITKLYIIAVSYYLDYIAVNTSSVVTPVNYDVLN